MIDVCDIQVMKPLLNEHGFHFSKAKGQNFLIQRWVPENIAEKAGVDQEASVLEIGPGIGPLTQQLALRANKVCAVELDKRLAPILKQTVGQFDNLEIIWDDVLNLDVPSLVEEKFHGLRPMACANLPYYITSPILTALLEADCFDSVTVMVQKEVAQRIEANRKCVCHTGKGFHNNNVPCRLGLDYSIRNGRIHYGHFLLIASYRARCHVFISPVCRNSLHKIKLTNIS